MRKLKKCIIVLLAVAAALLLAVGCGNESDSDAAEAEEMVESFMTAAQELDFETMEACTVSAEWDETVRDLLSVDAWNNFAVLMAPKMTYEITDVEESGKEATVTVKVSYIDAEDIYVDAFNSYVSEALAIVMENDDATEEDIANILDDILQEKAETMEDTYTETTLEFICVSSDDWKIDTVDEEIDNVLTANLIKAADTLNSETEEDLTSEDTDTTEDE